MIIMWRMGSQVSRVFDVAAAWRWCRVATYAGSLLGLVKNQNPILVASFNATEK